MRVYLNHGRSLGPYLQVNKVKVTFILMLPRRTGEGGGALVLISAVDVSGEFCTSAALRDVTIEQSLGGRRNTFGHGAEETMCPR
jgi:hypothetical protein